MSFPDYRNDRPRMAKSSGMVERDNVEIKQDYSRLMKMSKKEISSELQRSHKIIDLRDTGKEQMVTMIVRSRYGDRKVDEAFGLTKTPVQTKTSVGAGEKTPIQHLIDSNREVRRRQVARAKESMKPVATKLNAHFAQKMGIKNAVAPGTPGGRWVTVNGHHVFVKG